MSAQQRALKAQERVCILRGQLAELNAKTALFHTTMANVAVIPPEVLDDSLTRLEIDMAAISENCDQLAAQCNA